MVAHERAERQPPVGRTNAVERKLVHVHDDARRSEPVVEERHEALAPRENLRVIAVLMQEGQRVLDPLGGGVLERRDQSTSRRRSTSGRPSMNSPIFRPSVLKWSVARCASTAAWSA